MASINSRNGKLFFDFRYRGVRCKEYTKLEDVPANRRRVKQVLERIEAEIVLGTFEYKRYFPNSKKASQFDDHELRIERINSQVPNLSSFYETWYQESEVAWRFSHKETVALTFRKYLIPEFGSLPMDQIRKADVLSLRAKLAKKPRSNGKVGLSPARINKIIMFLKQVIQEAAERYDFHSPIRDLRPLKVKKTHIEPFSLEEVNLLVAHIRKDYKNYLIVRIFTGMRTGEIDGLKWEYIDFDRKEILIRETWTYDRMEYTKTDSSQREIQMSQPVFAALKDQYQKTGTSEFVFTNRVGLPICKRNFARRVWYPLLRLLDLKKRRPYQTRHTAATLWLAAGESPEWIAKQMGHTSTEMLFTVYSRFVPNLTRKDGSAFEKLIANYLETEI